MKSNSNKYPDLGLRILTGLLGAALILAGSAFSQWTYFAVFFVICIFSANEFYRLTWLDGMLPLKFLGTLNCLLIYTLTFLVESRVLSQKYYFCLLPVLALVFLVKLYKKEEKPFTNIAYTFLGIFYIGLPFSLLNFVVFASGIYNSHLVIGIMLILWCSDVGAYFVGVRYGRRKLFERVSPKKSWEGMIGAFLLALLASYMLGRYFHELDYLQWGIIAVIIVVTGTYGDLVESLFKRSIAIKDSSNILPGHGGFLDRFDGLLISLFFIVFYLKMFVY